MTNAGSDVLIVGAGMAGLMAAHRLRERGYRVILVDKGRAVGGRLATRRVGPGRADHGAQFFTVRTEVFQEWVDRWLAEGLVYIWSTGWSDGSLGTVDPDGHPRYAARGGMNALAQWLARGLDVRVGERIVAIRLADEGWEGQGHSGTRYGSRALCLTPPVPQSLALLDAGDVALARADRAALERVAYAPCLAGLFWIEGAVHLPEPGAVQRPDAPITWIADNQRKGISPGAKLVTVHAGPEHSRALWEATDDEVLEALRAELEPYLDPAATEREAGLQRWRYALPTTLHDERCLVAQDLLPLAFAGDAFRWARVEGAALSGMAAGDAIADRMARGTSGAG